jgi:hypothetical protein
MFLSRAEISRLTGYVRPSAQVRWLRRHGYRFTVNGLGEPVVAVSEVARKLVGGAYAKNDEPDWEALRGSQAQA